MACAGAALAAVGAFLAFQGKYLFRSEPVLQQAGDTLEKRSLQSRTAHNSAFCRANLENDAQTDAYDAVAEYAFYDESEGFSVYGADKNDLNKAVNAFLNDHPEVFWIDSSSGYRYAEYDDSIYAELNFTESGSQLQSDRETLAAAVEAAAAGAPDNASDYEAECYINDYLAERCAYNSDGANKHSSFGALVDGQAVCDGYSHAFQLLCQRLDIPCTVVEGNSDFNEDTEDGHMWNCVRLGDNWYHVDVTWNDSLNAANGAEHYFYLNLTTAEIERDHEISGDYDHRFENRGNFFNVFVPDCGSDEYNYMKRSFVTIKNPDDDEQILASLLSAARGQKSWCAYVIDDSADFDKISGEVINRYAADWIQGANHFTGGKPKIADSTKVVTYQNKRVIAFALEYENKQ